MIRVIQPGMLTTVQDEGRFEFLAYGLPRAGYMDRYAARMANILCGNPQDTALLEMTLSGGGYEFNSPCRIAICGADISPVINRQPVDMWTTCDLVAGSVLETGFSQQGCRAYLAVAGGLDVPVVMGSKSTYTRARVGGLEGRALKAGDKIVMERTINATVACITLPPELRHVFEDILLLRVLPGPQDDMFTPEGLDAMFGNEYRVSDEADRMGYRLEGPAIQHKSKADIVSDALCVGAVQVPGNGQPIVMMMDCGTTGGYTKIGTVIGPDLWKLAQAKSQDKVRFVRCNDEEAVSALREEAAKYERAQRLVQEQQPAVAQKQMQLTIGGEVFKICIVEEEQ